MTSNHRFHGQALQVSERGFQFAGILVNPLADNFEDALLAALERIYAQGRQDVLSQLKVVATPSN